MSWDVDEAAEWQRGVLLRLICALFTSVHILGGDGAKPVVLRRVRRSLWTVLRPAESAVRRLIVIAARGMEPAAYVASGPVKRTVRKSRKARSSTSSSMPSSTSSAPRSGGTRRAPAFPLIDPRKDFGERPRRRKGAGPRITVIGVDERISAPEKPPELDDDPVDATRLMRRLRAVRAALEDISAQAQRLIDYQSSLPEKKRLSPMRPGLPPGYRSRIRHPVDEILQECDGLAHLALNDLWKAKQGARVVSASP